MNADLLPFAGREPARQLPWPLACLVIAGLSVVLWSALLGFVIGLYCLATEGLS